METIIQVKDVTKTFVGKDNKVEALKGINLDICKGEIYGIIGMSGAGKSTLVRCLNFLERPTTGTVFIEGKGQMETIIQVKDVTKTFVGKDNKVEALKGINLDI